MPIQNVGTLIENIVVAESASVLLDHVCVPRRLGFATAFAMPALSEWRPHSQAVGMSATALRAVATGRGDSEFLEAMRVCLQHSPEQGPNAALLVSLVATRRRASLRLWANDIIGGHYGNAIPSLEQIADRVRLILPEYPPSIDMAVCDLPYPSSLDHLRTTLGEWNDVGAILGFLDPMRYVRGSRQGAETSSADHREWLAILSNREPSLVVQFTGNRDSQSLELELAGLREDLKQCGFADWAEVQRQSYVVSVGSRDDCLLDELEKKVRHAWNIWCDTAPEIVKRHLTIRRSSGPFEPVG
jgi:hypothetical protein